MKDIGKRDIPSFDFQVNTQPGTESGVDSRALKGIASHFGMHGERRYRNALRSSGRYHGIEGNPYALPNDEGEVHRLNELQFVFRTLLGTNVVPPISPTSTDICIPPFLSS
jgi:hypothetical protein